MNKKRTLLISFVLIILLLGLGYFLPLETYTTTHGCPSETTPNKRISLLFGDSIEKIKTGDVEPLPTEGCSQNTKFTLYLL